MLHVWSVSYIALLAEGLCVWQRVHHCFYLIKSLQPLLKIGAALRLNVVCVQSAKASRVKVSQVGTLQGKGIEVMQLSEKVNCTEGLEMQDCVRWTRSNVRMELLYNNLWWKISKAPLFLSPVREIRRKWSVSKEIHCFLLCRAQVTSLSSTADCSPTF